MFSREEYDDARSAIEIWELGERESACNPSIAEDEAGDLQVQDQPGVVIMLEKWRGGGGGGEK